jgi:hypothetical protein
MIFPPARLALPLISGLWQLHLHRLNVKMSPIAFYFEVFQKDEDTHLCV